MMNMTQQHIDDNTNYVLHDTMIDIIDAMNFGASDSTCMQVTSFIDDDDVCETLLD